MNQDTPRTEAIREDLLGIPSEAQTWKLFKKLEDMERELNAARAEIERLDTAGIHSCHKDCQRPNCVLRRELKAVTEKRDGLKQAVDCANDLLASVTEQRDRLAEALRKFVILTERMAIGIEVGSDLIVTWDIADEALQSLTTNEL